LPIEAIIFDFDGVLVESLDVKTAAFARMYEKYGPETVAQVVDYHLRHGGMSRYEKFRYYEKILLGHHIGPGEEKRLGEMFSALVVEAVVHAPWVPGAYDFLSAHYRTQDLYVASGTPEPEMIAIVKRREVEHFFVSVHGSPASKEEIIMDICLDHRYDRDSVLMVGDSQTDYEGARKAGILFVGRKSGSVSFFPPEVTVLPDLTGLHDYCVAL
jgi:HAD superfamily hydrolase (TIGR01549 family)